MNPYTKEKLQRNTPLPPEQGIDADLYLALDPDRYQELARKLGASARIAAILDNLPILFATGDIVVEKALTEQLQQWVDVVPASVADLDGYGHKLVYQVKPEFEKYLQSAEDERI